MQIFGMSEISCMLYTSCLVTNFLFGYGGRDNVIFIIVMSFFYFDAYTNEIQGKLIHVGKWFFCFVEIFRIRQNKVLENSNKGIYRLMR